MATANPIAPKKPGMKAAPKSGGGLMSKKIAGLPVPVVVGGVILAIVVGLYLRNKLSSSTASTGATTADTTPVDTSGGATDSPDTSGDQSNEDLANALNGLTALLGGGAAPITGDTTTGDTTGTGTGPYASLGVNPLTGAPYGTTYSDVGVTPSAITGPGPQTGSITGPGPATMPPGTVTGAASVPDATVNFAQAAVARSAAITAAGGNPAFGGVTSTVTNKKTGVTTTTYASGRIVQQAPGKTAYVAKK